MKWLFVALLMCVPRLASAQTCSFVSVVNLNFGIYSGPQLASSGSITYNCTGLGAGTVTIDLSRGVALSYLPRQLRDGALHLDYNLYLDAGFAAIWGDGTGGTAHYGPVAPPDGTNVSVNMFGRVFAAQNVPAGTYFDTLQITLNF